MSYCWRARLCLALLTLLAAALTLVFVSGLELAVEAGVRPLAAE